MRSMPAILLCSFFSAASLLCQPTLRTGDEIFLQKYVGLIKGKSVGIITNQTGTLADGRQIVDAIDSLAGVKVVALFAPEHGIRGDAAAGSPVGDSVDQGTGIRTFSLYGNTTKPTREMLKGVDVLIYDVQDVGARFYTFISTLDLTLEAAAENNVEYIVLDRPDMLRADLVDGPVLDDSLRSFVGIQPIPSIYGMTPGEFATLVNDEHVMNGGVKADLTVIKMENYRRGVWYDETGLKWVAPSPNLSDMNSVEVYPGTVLIEGTNVSEGRGTEHPFEYIGSPYIDSKRLIDMVESQNLAGIKFEPIDFTPRPLRAAGRPKFNGQLCHGVRVTVVDRNIFRPVETGVTLVWAIHKLYPREFHLRDTDFDRLCGTRDIRLGLLAGKTPGEMFAGWSEGLKRFERVREKHLLYN